MTAFEKLIDILYILFILKVSLYIISGFDNDTNINNVDMSKFFNSFYNFIDTLVNKSTI